MELEHALSQSNWTSKTQILLHLTTSFGKKNMVDHLDKIMQKTQTHTQKNKNTKKQPHLYFSTREDRKSQ